MMQNDSGAAKPDLFVRVRKKRRDSLILSLILPFTLLFLWIVLSLSDALNPYFIPPPQNIIKAFFSLLNSHHLIPGIVSSIGRILLSILISSAISLPLGIIMSSSEAFRWLLDPLIKLRYLPAFALMPLLIIITGIDEANKITFLVISITLYFLPSIIISIDAVPNELIDVARTLGASEYQLVRYILIPASLPDIFLNFLVINGISWNSLMCAEIINAQHGLGHIMNLSRQRGQMDIVIVVLLIIYIFAVLMDFGINRLMKYYFKWKYI